MPVAMLMLSLPSKAQEQYEDDEHNYSTRTKSIPELISEEETFDELQPFNIHSITDELVAIILLAVLVSLVRHFVNKRDRKGCTFFIVFFAVIFYIIYKFL